MDLTIENVGPIPELKITFPTEGSVLLLRGPNGSGKTTALDTARVLINGGSHELTKRDQTLKGVAEGFGAKLTLSTRSRRTGEVDVVSLEGRIDLARLVNPGFIDKLAADNARIKALIALAGKPANPTLFAEAVGGIDQYKALAKVETQALTDPLELAAHLKRDIEAEARRAEEEVAKADQQILSLREAIGETDLSQPHNTDALQAEYTAAVESQATLRTRREAHERWKTEQAERQARLEQLKSQATGPSVETLRQSVENTRSGLESLRKRRDEYQKLIDAIDNDIREQEHALTLAVNRHSTAEQHAKDIAALTEALISTGPEAITEDQLNDASSRVVAARTAVEVGAAVRTALEKQKQIDALGESRDKAATRGSDLRNKAKAVEDVLASLLPPCALRVDDGRLVLTTTRGDTYFDDLSAGEKWALAIELAATVLGAESPEQGDLPIVTCEQEAWESLDAEHRALIQRKAKECRVIILTAEADHDAVGKPLRVEEYQP